nr:xylulose kinase-1 [Tanacetum cinerariifolium]
MNMLNFGMIGIKNVKNANMKKNSYDKAYNDMQQKIERLQAQLRDLKGKSKDTSSVSNTLDPLSQKLENENVELEYQVLNYAKENAHLKTTYKNVFDSISVTRIQTKTIIDSLQSKLHDTIYENGFFRMNHFEAFRLDNFAPNKHVKASVMTKPITVSQPHVITKNDVNYKTNGFSPKDVKSTTRTRRPQPRNNPKNDKVPSKSKSIWLSNNLEKIEENYRNLLSSLNQKHMSSECNNIKLAIRNAKSEVVCAMYKQCLITINHDVYVLKYVNDMNSRALNKNANVSNVENQKKHTPKVRKPKRVGSNERLASSKPSKHRSCLRWSPTGRLFDLKGKIIASSEFESQSNCSNGDDACTSNPQELISKQFPNLTFSMTADQNWFDTLLILLLSEYKPMDKEDNGDNECLKIYLGLNSKKCKKSLGRDSKGRIIILPPISFEEHVDVQRETKARTLLLQSLLEDHMADFHHLDDAREIWLAVKARFGGNDESKKMRKTMLKQKFSEFKNKTEEAKQMYGLMVGFESDFAVYAGNAAGSVNPAA